MREIKFRGRKPNGEWVYGDLVTVEKTDAISDVSDDLRRYERSI